MKMAYFYVVYEADTKVTRFFHVSEAYQSPWDERVRMTVNGTYGSGKIGLCQWEVQNN